MRRGIALLLLFATPVWAQAGGPVEQGWTQSEREIFWNSPVGSRLVPFEWFARLEQAGNPALFAAPEHLAGYGFLPGTTSAANPGGLPVGLARERDRVDGPWVGLSCAACHARAIDLPGGRVTVDGAGGMVDVVAFDRDLSAALTRTGAEDAGFARFADRLGTPEAERGALRERVRRVAAERAVAVARDAAAVEAGPGRFDLVGTLNNAVTAGALGLPGNARPAAAAVRPGPVWGVAMPVAVGVQQVLASHGTVDLVPNAWPIPGSVSVFDLVKIGALLRKLEPPTWPAALPSPDPALVEQGRGVFAAACAGCHEAGWGTRAPVYVPVERLGTDGTAMRTRAAVATGVLAGRGVPNGPVLGARAAPEAVTGFVAVGIAAQLPRAGVGVAAGPAGAYAAGALAGVWAAAPYLHNGSVPNLRQLLTVPAARVTRFGLAGGGYDAVGVGLPAQDGPGPVFDTTLPGNANTGHEYGTELPEEAKASLLAFLKSL